MVDELSVPNILIGHGRSLLPAPSDLLSQFDFDRAIFVFDTAAVSHAPHLSIILCPLNTFPFHIASNAAPPAYARPI